ncbi:MAG TPA: hypothetical protein VFS30_01245 [Dehalococcoidia bacterium]|nr:hypothetical protein [Dehalococcoidia bacterium]
MFKMSTKGEAKSSRHDPLPKDVAVSLKEQFSSLAGQDLSGYTCAQERSNQKGAKHDLHIYDASGELRYEGRRFDGAQGISFWKPGAV